MEKADLVSLVLRCQAGNPDAWNELIVESQPLIRFQCLKYLKNPEDIEDATQDVLVLMLAKLNTLKDPGSFKSWLNQTAAHHCINLLRKKRELPLFEDEDGNSILNTFEVLDLRTIPHESFDHAETQRMISELIDALPAEQQACINMYFRDEMRISEIAEAMETPESTVKSRLMYAKKSIQAGVKEYERKGIKLYGIPPLYLLAFFLRQDSNTQRSAGASFGSADTLSADSSSIAPAPDSAPCSSPAGSTIKAAAATKTTILSTKLIAAGLAVTIALGVGGLYLSSRSSEEPPSSTSAITTTEPTSQPTTNVQEPSSATKSWLDILAMDEICYAKLLDFDGDGMNDLLVGAYVSDSDIFKEASPASLEAGTFAFFVFNGNTSSAEQLPDFLCIAPGMVASDLNFYRHSETGKHYLGYYLKNAHEGTCDEHYFASVRTITFLDFCGGVFYHDEIHFNTIDELYESGDLILDGEIPEDVFHSQLAKYELIESLPFQTPPDPSEFLYTVDTVQQQLKSLS